MVGPECQAKKHGLDFVSEGMLMDVLQQENGGVVFVLWQL